MTVPATTRVKASAKVARRDDGGSMNLQGLVVDDDPGMVRTLCDIFRLRDGVGVHSGEETVETAR